MKTRIQLLLLLSLISTTAFGQIYYVTPHGKATNDGSSWKKSWTLKKAAQSVQPGDTVIVRKGAYTNDTDNYFLPARGGRAGAPITLKGENPLDPPILTRTKGGVFSIKVPYIVLQDIGCRAIPGASCVGIKDTHHVTIRRLHAEGCHQGVTIRNSDDNVVEDSILMYNQEGIYVLQGSDRNKIRRNIVMYNGLGTKGDRDAIAVGGWGAGNDNLIDGNIVAFNGQIGIGVFDAPRTVVRNNHVYRSGGTGIHLGVNSVNSLIDGNRVEGNGTNCKTATNIAGVTVRTGSSGTIVSNNLVLNNCVAAGDPWGSTDPRGGLDIRSWPAGVNSAMDNVKLLNNHVSGTLGGPDFYVDPRANINGLIVR